MADFGIKVSQPGKDVQDSGDMDMLFSSAWPTPKILFNGRIRANIGFSPTIIVTHNLGYVPMFLPYVTKNGRNTSIFREILSADDKYIYYNAPGGPGTSGPIDIGLYIFDINIEVPYKAPEIDVGSSSSTGIDTDFGIKMTKKNKDISSSTLKDFILHSSTRSPLIHEVVAASLPDKALPASTTYTHTHSLPYSPMFLAYIQVLSTDGALRYNFANNFAGVVASGSTIALTGDLYTAGIPKVSIVILKDPFILDTVEVIKA